jgi:hypothetical protein
MSFRTTVFATLGLLGFAANNTAYAQPVAPQRPHTGLFPSLFGPAGNAVPNAGMMPQGNVIGGQGVNGLAPGLGALGLNPYGIAILGPNGNIQAVIPGSGQPVVFNNLGHWYSGNYGHWYPKGIRNGAGVLATSGSGAGFGGGGGGSQFGGMGGGVGGIGSYGGGAGAIGTIGTMPGGIRR